MSSNKNSGSNLKLSLFGAAAAAGVGFLGYYLYMKSLTSEFKAKSGVKNISKVTCLKVIKQLKKEFYTSFSTMTMMANQIKQQARGRVSEAEIKEFVLMHPQIKESLQSSEARAYNRFKVTEEQFQNAVENLFKDDAEIQTHRNELKAMFDKASSGQEIDIKTEIPQSLTSQSTLVIVEEVMKATCKKIQEAFLKIKEEQGSINMNDPQTLQALNEIKIDDVKASILESHGLENFDDPGAKILQYATQQYRQQNIDGFTEKLMQLELKHQKSMEMISQDPSDPNLVERIFSQPIQMPGMGGMGGPMGFRPGMRRTPAGASAQGVEVGSKIEREEEKKEEEPKKAEEEPKKEEQQEEKKAEEVVEQKTEEVVEQKTEEVVEQKQEEEVVVEQKVEEVVEQKVEEVVEQKVEEVVEQKVEEVVEQKVEEVVEQKVEEVVEQKVEEVVEQQQQEEVVIVEETKKPEEEQEMSTEIIDKQSEQQQQE